MIHQMFDGNYEQSMFKSINVTLCLSSRGEICIDNRGNLWQDSVFDCLVKKI
jgi:hypothetical protein